MPRAVSQVEVVTLAVYLLGGESKQVDTEDVAVKRALKAAGLPGHFSPHRLRQTFATLLLVDGVSPAYVQEQLGHADISLTVGAYGRWLRKKAPGAVDRLDEVHPQSIGDEVVAEATTGGEDDSQVVEEMVRPGRFERPTYRFVARPRGKPPGGKGS